MPSSWRSLRRLVSNSANTPSISRKHLPAAVEVSIGCSRARSATPLALRARTMSCRSPMLRASRSIRVTTSSSPSRMNCISSSSSSRPARDVPETFSARTSSQPAAVRALFWIERSWSIVLTRAYQYAPAPRLLKKRIDLPEPTTIAEATANIGRIATLVAQRKLGVDEGNDLTAILGKWIEAKVSAELEERIIMIEVALAKANINLGIAVQGGLPDLPLGPDDGKLIMPAKLLPLSPQPSDLPSDKPPPTDGDAP